MITIEKHIQFFDWQIEEIERAYWDYLNKKVLDLWRARKLSIGKIWEINDNTGAISLRFKKGGVPRLKLPRLLCYVNANAGDPFHWPYTYREFRQGYVDKFCSCIPVEFQRAGDQEFAYVTVAGVDINFLDYIRKDLETNPHPLIVLADEDPPIEYLLNLREYVRSSPESAYLQLPHVVDDSNWWPKDLNEHGKLVPDVIGIMENSPCTILQGPPGVGKTRLIAGLCSYFMSQGKKVCVTALTNKALMEVVKNEALSDWLKQEKVSKTNLSIDESITYPSLRRSSDPSQVAPFELVLTSYYVFSRLLKDLPKLEEHYDILIIEEASQAFLATLDAFSRFGRKVLIVGDPKQLTPTVLGEGKAHKIDTKIMTVVEGLKTFSYNQPDISYRITHTFRLTERAAVQTGVFYRNALVSESVLNSVRPLVKGASSRFFCPNGGASLLLMDIGHEGKVPIEAFKIILDIVSDIKAEDAKTEIAVLAPFKDTILALYDRFESENFDLSGIDIETIDRIQGLTCDLSILLVPLERGSFGFQENRFNVATSRAKRGTLIISDTHIHDLIGIPTHVRQFLSKVTRIEN